MALLPYADPAAAAYVDRIPGPELEDSWQLIETDGTRLMRGEAGVALLCHLRATRLLGRACRRFRLVPIVGILDRLFLLLKRALGPRMRRRAAARRTP